MIINNVRRLHIKTDFLSKVLPPIEYETDDTVTKVSLTEALGIRMVTDGETTPEKEAFRTFLYNNGALASYINNVFERQQRTDPYPPPVTRSRRCSIIDSSFGWSTTSEGHNYWSSLHGLWRSQAI